jgi:pimeloyl-ACP methyl ester carboxylesterase
MMTAAATHLHRPPAPTAIEIDGVPIHHVDAGPRSDAETAPAVLLLPGIVATHRYFSANVGALARHYRVLAPDLPGFGRSGKPDAPYSTAWFVDRVVRFLDAKQVARAHVAGNSLGGQVAMALARRHPERVERLVLVAPAGISTERLRFFRPLLRAANAASSRGLRLAPRVPRAAWSMLFRAVFPDRPDLAERYVRGYVDAVASDEYPLYLRACLRAMDGVLASPMMETARHIEHPTLIVWGRRDALLPVAAARRLHRAMQRAELLVYERAGHCPMVDEPERWNRDVLRFLADRRDATPSGGQGGSLDGNRPLP